MAWGANGTVLEWWSAEIGHDSPNCDYRRPECNCPYTEYSHLLRGMCSDSMGIEQKLEEHNLDVRDFVHFLLCIASVVFGFVYRKIEGPEARKWAGSTVGLCMVYVVMGVHVWHFILVTLLAGVVLRHFEASTRLILVSIQMLLYLTTFRAYTFNDRIPYTHMSLILMMLTVKLVGVAFEMRNSLREKHEKKTDESHTIDPKFSDIVHYAFCYIGILVGPYVRYRTYDDFITMPFSRFAKDKRLIKKLIYLPVNAVIFMLLVNVWPLLYATTEEFNARNMLYKVTYCVIQYQMFRQWMYCGLLLSECICSAAGFGAYPVENENKYTHGPTKDYEELKQISFESAPSIECDFVTNSCIDIHYMQTSPWPTKYTREWNKSIQYFMGMYVYKSIPKTPALKPFRLLITILTCSYWHGLEIGYHIGMIILPMYVPTDKLYLKIYEKLSGWKSSLLACFMFVVQYYVIGFGVMSFLLADWSKLISYYTSVMFLPYIFLIFLHLIGLVIVKRL